MKVGSVLSTSGTCDFTVWAPLRESVSLSLCTPQQRTIPMVRESRGYWRVTVPGVEPGSRYRYSLDTMISRPDPASHFQPEGVHGPSEVVDHSSFRWTDQEWKGVELNDYIIYEIHTGTFTHEGTFDGIIEKLPHLISLGVTALEIMPVAQFPGERNWGYDGAYSFAVQNSYGGPSGLKRLVDECHRQGFSVILDVVYNHFGPEGTYVADFGPYFTNVYKTPWGDAINFDEALSDPVRDFFVENALFWLDIYHIDALRLDAIQGIYDRGARHFLEQLADAIDVFSKRTGRTRYVMAESDLNDTRVIKPREAGGYGIHAQWSDDWHHSVYSLLAGDNKGYYGDYGSIENVRKAYVEGFVYSWTYSKHRRKCHGSSSADLPGCQFVICTQNHDQIGNRAKGERLPDLLSFEAVKLAAGALMVAPNIPLLFMGEEFAERAPFPYFVSHSDPQLVEAVCIGRRDEFYHRDYAGEIPAPQDPMTFASAKLNWGLKKSGPHAAMLSWYRELIRFRIATPALRNLDKRRLEAKVPAGTRILVLSRWHEEDRVVTVMNFDNAANTYRNDTGRELVKVFDSCDAVWLGPGGTLPQYWLRDEEATVPAHCFGLYRANAEGKEANPSAAANQSR